LKERVKTLDCLEPTKGRCRGLEYIKKSLGAREGFPIIKKNQFFLFSDKKSCL
jgi:hypothetical protein